MMFLRKRQLKAFTLIEMLLGVLIFSVVALTLYTIFASGVMLNRKAENLNGVYREARWAIDQLERDLQRITDYDFSNSYEGSLSFYGDNDKLQFILATDSGLKVIQYSLEEPQYGQVHKVTIGQSSSRNRSQILKYEEERIIKHLVRQQQSFVDFLALGDEENVEKEVLSSKVKKQGLKFQYAKRDEEDPKILDWKDQWDDTAFPVGIRVQLTFVNQETGGELDLERDLLIAQGFWSASKPVQQ